MGFFDSLLERHGRKFIKCKDSDAGEAGAISMKPSVTQSSKFQEFFSYLIIVTIIIIFIILALDFYSLHMWCSVMASVMNI